MMEIKCETIEDGKLAPVRRVTILVNGQPAWMREGPLMGIDPENPPEDYRDLQHLAWLREAIRRQCADVDTLIKNKIQELRERP
jgi:hypothetical protein